MPLRWHRTNLIFPSCNCTLSLLTLDGPCWWPWRVWRRIFQHPLDVSTRLCCKGRTLMVSLGIPTTRPWDDPHDRAFLGRRKIVGQDAIGFRTLGGHEFFGLDSKGRLRPWANKLPFLLRLAGFPANLGIFFIFLWDRTCWERNDFVYLKCVQLSI